MSDNSYPVGKSVCVSVKDASGKLEMCAMQLRDRPSAAAWFVWDGAKPWSVGLGARAADIQTAIRLAYLGRPQPPKDGQPSADMVRAVASAALAAVGGAGLAKE